MSAATQNTRDYVSTMFLEDGTFLLVEPENPLGVRVFKTAANDTYEWAWLTDVTANGTRARFYGWASKELPDSMRSF